jgi:hypothetical protein
MMGFKLTVKTEPILKNVKEVIFYSILMTDIIHRHRHTNTHQTTLPLRDRERRGRNGGRDGGREGRGLF